MRVLQLCSKVPYPAKDGGCMAMLNLAEMLFNNGYEVKILAIETYKHPAPAEGYPVQFTKKYQPESVLVNTKTSPLNALKNLILSNKSYHLARFKNQHFEQKLIVTLQSYKPEIVVLDSLFTCGYIDTIKFHSKAKIIYRAHNVEHLIWQEIALKSNAYLKNKYLKIQSERLKKEEFQLIEKCDGILAITEKDKHFFETHFGHKNLMNLPFTLDINAYPFKNNYTQKALFFIGAMDWYPNLEGVKWFIDRVWPTVSEQHPAAKFYIAGKAMPNELKNLETKNIFNSGEVHDAKEFMDHYPIMIAPLFSGGGLKIKIVEAMAMGKIVICNTEAAAGIPFTDKKNVLIANSAATFIEVLNDCLSHLKDHIPIGENARLLVEENFNSMEKGRALSLFLKQ